MKNKLRYLRYRNLHSELARYGYEYTLSMTVLKCKKKAFKFCKFFDAS